MSQLPDYTVRESSRAKSVRLKMSTREGLIVVVPRGFDRTRIPGLLERKQEWLEKAAVKVDEQQKFFLVIKHVEERIIKMMLILKLYGGDPENRGASLACFSNKPRVSVKLQKICLPCVLLPFPRNILNICNFYIYCSLDARRAHACLRIPLPRLRPDLREDHQSATGRDALPALRGTGGAQGFRICRYRARLQFAERFGLWLKGLTRARDALSLPPLNRAVFPGKPHPAFSVCASRSRNRPAPSPLRRSLHRRVQCDIPC